MEKCILRITFLENYNNLCITFLFIKVRRRKYVITDKAQIMMLTFIILNNCKKNIRGKFLPQCGKVDKTMPFSKEIYRLTLI